MGKLTNEEIRELISDEIETTLRLMKTATPRERVLLAETVQKLYSALDAQKSQTSESWRSRLAQLRNRSKLRSTNNDD